MVHLESLGADFVVGEEVGKKGTPHLQGCIQRAGKWRPLPLLKGVLGKAHFEKCKGSWVDNVRYCSKDGKYTASFDVPRFLRSKMPLCELEDEVRTLEVEAREEVHKLWVQRGKPREDVSWDSMAFVEWAEAHEQLAARLTL